MLNRISVGTAGWAIPRTVTGQFPSEGTALERYATVFDCVEINSTFRKVHRASTYERWAHSVPPHFRFHLKLPNEITHVRRLADCEDLINTFLDQTSVLGERRGALLVQLPPKLAYDGSVASAFFTSIRSRYAGLVACEPRHGSWFSAAADHALEALHVARVAADPAVVPEAARPGGWNGFAYFRWHGAPRTYYSTYDDATLEGFAAQVMPLSMPVICIFDNTALGGGAVNALSFQALITASAREKNSHATSERKR